MWNIVGEVSRAIESLGVKAKLLGPEESTKLWSLVADTYAGGNSEWPLWEHLRDDASVQIEDPLRRLSDFLGQTPALLLFEPNDEGRYFEFSSGKDIPRVLEECFRFEFYVADRNLYFLFCVNHHDFLIGAGTAKDWVANLKSNESR